MRALRARMSPPLALSIEMRLHARERRRRLDTAAQPITPVPIRNSELGSGTGVGTEKKSALPPPLLIKTSKQPVPHERRVDTPGVFVKASSMSRVSEGARKKPDWPAAGLNVSDAAAVGITLPP